MKFLSCLSLLLLLTGCCSDPCFNYSLEGADEFVIDSYKIRQGKLAILEMEGIEIEELGPEDFQEYKDTIAEDDILNIALYHPKRQDLIDAFHFINSQVGFRVKNGVIDLPDIPSVYVEGLTLEEARQQLRQEYRKEISDVELFISYKERRQRKVELTGMVGVPFVPVDGKIRLYEVLAAARVPNSANFFMSYLVRDGCQLGLDMHKLVVEGDMCENIVMRGGDKVFIAAPSDCSIYVMGEVIHPKVVPLPYGYMSLREALVSAGGIPFTGDRNRIQVIRGNLACPKVYVLSWEHIINLPNDSLLLMPGDTIYVSEKPITQWNRFISQLLPSFNGLQVGYDAYRIFGG
jgi:polysaccharide biosynthesis/export protein